MLKLRANSIVKGKIEGVAIQNRKIFDRTAARKRADARKRVRIIQNQKGISKKPPKKSCKIIGKFVCKTYLCHKNCHWLKKK